MAKWIYKKYEAKGNYSLEKLSTYKENTDIEPYLTAQGFEGYGIKNGYFYGTGGISGKFSKYKYIKRSPGVLGISTTPESSTLHVLENWDSAVVFQTITVYEAKANSYSQGAYIGEVTAEDGTYTSNARNSDGYWYVKDRLANVAPTISGSDEDLGDKKTAFSKTFTVDDGDAGNVLDVVVRLNNTQISTISNATRKQEYTVDINQAKFDALTLNVQNTIEITVSDGQGASAVRRWYFKRSNTNPTVTVENTNMGEKNEPFSFAFTPNDADGDAITGKVFLDDVQIFDLGTLTKGQKKTVTLGKMDYSKLRNGSHKIRIEATDSNGGRGYGYVDFTKKVTTGWYKLTKQTNNMAVSTNVQVMAELAEGAELIVKVCNNALDESPTWETVETAGEVHNFTNSTKTGENWAVGVWVTVKRNTATKDSYFYGFVGNFQ